MTVVVVTVVVVTARLPVVARLAGQEHGADAGDGLSPGLGQQRPGGLGGILAGR